MTLQSYTYRVQTIDKVVDGDTLDLTVNLGFGIRTTQRFRLLGIQAPESRGKDKERGKVVAKWLSDRLEGPCQQQKLYVKSVKHEGFGRWLGTLFIVEDDVRIIDVNSEMLNEGHAVPYED